MTVSPPLPPLCVEAEHRRWIVSRVWPGTDGSLPLEVTMTEGRPRSVRAGWYDGGSVRLLRPGEDPKLPDLARIAAGGTVVSHRPGTRAVVHSPGIPAAQPDRTGDEGGPETFTKVVRPRRAERVLAGVERAAAFAGPFRTPVVLDSGDGHVSFEAVAGRSLHHAAEFDAETWADAWEQVMAGWETAIQDPGELRGAPIHDAAAEAGVLRHWARRAEPYLTVGDVMAGAAAGAGDVQRVHADTVELLTEAVEQAAAELLSLPTRRMVPAHRDLHDKQLLFTEEFGPALLDVDTASLADPALDPANLRAHAWWRWRQGLWTRQQAETVRETINDASYRAGVSSAALDIYERATLLRISCIYAFRPPYVQIAAELRAELLGSR